MKKYISAITVLVYYVITILLVYVVDVVLTSNSVIEINVVKVHLHSRFLIKDLSLLKYFLDLEVTHSLDELGLNKRKYCLDLISEVEMLGFKPAPTPSNPSTKLHANEGALLQYLFSFQRLI